MIHLFIRIVLMVLSLVFIVPVCTGGRVALRRDGLIGGFFALLVIAFFNSALWLGFGVATVGGALVLNLLTFGLVGLCLNALAFKLAAWLMPGTLRVDSYGAAFIASLVMTVMSYVIQLMIG